MPKHTDTHTHTHTNDLIMNIYKLLQTDLFQTLAYREDHNHESLEVWPMIAIQRKDKTLKEEIKKPRSKKVHVPR